MIYINNTNMKDIWVTSDYDPVGQEWSFDENKLTEEQAILIAIAEFLGFDPEMTLKF